MVKRKDVRTRGKLQLSKYFQEFEKGDEVAIVRELSVPKNFPEKTIGKTGEIEGKRGEFYIVKVNEFDREKRFIIHPIHLRRKENKKEGKNK